MYQVNKTREILLLRLKKPVILHSIEFEILTYTMLKIAFPGLKLWGGRGGGGTVLYNAENSISGPQALGGGAALQADPLEARTFGARI